MNPEVISGFLFLFIAENIQAGIKRNHFFEGIVTGFEY